MTNLAVQERLLRVIAKDAPRATLPERQARAALVAVVVAMHNGSLDKLMEPVKGFLQSELGETDALADGEIFDLMGFALIELQMIEEDLDAMQLIAPTNLKSSKG